MPVKIFYIGDAERNDNCEQQLYNGGMQISNITSSVTLTLMKLSNLEFKLSKYLLVNSYTIEILTFEFKLPIFSLMNILTTISNPSCTNRLYHVHNNIQPPICTPGATIYLTILVLV